jgi:ribosome-dependent ATPase
MAAIAAGRSRQMTAPAKPICVLRDVSHRYRASPALEHVSLDLPNGCMTGFIGPDGVGKSSLLALVSGARRIQSGDVRVMGGDMREAAHRAVVCPRIAYMPQGLGRNLYPDLSVRENIDFFGRLFGLAQSERDERIERLLRGTGLAPFSARAAKNLSGGMRQKLGLCCALIHDPDLLILDEPTTGVDPLSRRQFWDLIASMHAARPEMSVLIATAYMEEAERFDWLVAMDRGRVLAAGTPAELKGRTGAATIEDVFVRLLPGHKGPSERPRVPARRPSLDNAPVIATRNLTKRFGDFVAVDHVSFTIERGEIFGFVGSNGCGKTTTMKLLTGLLPADDGEALVLGRRIDAKDIGSRRRVGYMSQSFSLYTELTVRQNLDLHARLFGLPSHHARTRIAELIQHFGLAAYQDVGAAALPLGIRQRLSLAVAIVHEPEILILDEPTSGVDPLARDRFWELLISLSRDSNVTIFVSTHFMNEAARCDRISLMDAGRVLITDTPANLIASRNAANLEDAFISYLEEASGEAARGPAVAPALDRSTAAGRSSPDGRAAAVGMRRMFAYALRESLELMRDPVRLSFAFFGTVFLMLIFGFGITTDVDSLTFAALDRDQTPESRAYLGEIRGSRYFVERPPVMDYADLDRRLRSGEIQATIEIPPGFGRDIKRERRLSVGVWIDGAMPFHAQTIRGYLQGLHQQYLSDPALKSTISVEAPAAAAVEPRFRYNQHFDSIYAMVPSSMAILLVMIPSILMALAIVREKELGSITNLYVTPVKPREFLLGKQIPYVTVSVINFLVLFLMAVFVFKVPLKGSFATLALGALLYVTATTGIGMLVSAFTRTQIAALVGTAIVTTVPAVQFSGMLTPVSSLSGAAALMGYGFPMTYFLRIIIGTFTKGLGLQELGGSLLSLAIFTPALIGLSLLFLRKQEA